MQLDRVTRNLGRDYPDRRSQLAQLLRDAAAVTPREARRKTERFYDPFLAAQVTDTLLGEISPPPAPSDWLAASVDGSHIDVDRHLPVPCYLLNLGGCVLTYGAQPDAHFFSRPHLAAEPDELYLSDPERPTEEEQVTGNLLGLYRTVRELERLAEVVKECPADLPTLALVDGTLILWGLAGQGYRPFIRQFIINEGLLPALEQFRKLARERRLTPWPPTSPCPGLPRWPTPSAAASAPTNWLTAASRAATAAPTGSPAATSICSWTGTCSGTAGAGQRSPLYRTNSLGAPGILRGTAAGLFLLPDAGEEIARVEVPQWVAEDEDLLRWATA